MNMTNLRKEILIMNENEKDILRQISETLPKLDKDKQSYVLGVAEGMAIVRESEKRKEEAIA